MAEKNVSPSLNQLYQFIYSEYNQLEEYEKGFFDPENFKVLEIYLYGKMTGDLYNLIKMGDKNTSQSSKIPQSTFYLGGEKKMSCDEPITDEIITEVDNIIKNTDLSQCYGMEIYSVMENHNRFNTFKKLLNDYKEYSTHLYYKPGGEGYLYTKHNFEKTTHI